MNDQLTRRQKDVMKLLSQGKSTDEIAVALSVSINTIRRHLSDIFARLNVSSQVQAVVLYLNAGREESSPKQTQSTAILSKREKEILSLFELGMTSKQVAFELGIAPSTAREYLRRAKEKLNG